MPSVRPFQFTGLPRYSREQVALQASISAYLSARPYQPDFVEGLQGLLEKYLKVPCKVSAPEMKTVARRDLGTLLPSTACLVVVGAAPGEHKLIVDIDQGLASFVIEKLLGGNGDAERLQRPLTDVEEGVLSFLLLRVLAHFHDGTEAGRSMAVTLDRFASSLNDIQAIADTATDYVMLGSRVSFGKHAGYVRVLLPSAIVTERFGKAIAQSGAKPDEHGYMLSLLDSLGETAVVGRAEIATLDLGPSDLASLELGDIVILENHQVQKTPEGIQGVVFIKLGAGRNGGVRGRILDGEQTRVEVSEIVIQEQPQEEQMVDEAQAGDNLAETEGLLRDVPAPVVVELGRIRMNTAQVVRLKQGQILRLPRGANDPVDLVVNGKLFARGELIEVDGELGVRLIQVVGAG